MDGVPIILLAEDEEPVRKLVKTFLEGYGYEVLVADDAQSAIRIMNEKSDSIDMLITDLRMPGMDGKELARKLCKMKPGLKVLYMSGYAEVEMRQLTGCGNTEVQFLSKPFTNSELQRKIQLVLADC